MISITFQGLLSVSSRGWDPEPTPVWGQLEQLSQISLDSHGNTDVIIVFLRSPHDSVAIICVVLVRVGVKKTFDPELKFTPGQKGTLGLCALQYFPGTWWFSEAMPADSPLALLEQDPDGFWRFGFSFLFRNANSAKNESLGSSNRPHCEWAARAEVS